ncbi:MAG: family 43 glycosylhydrolase [Clostridia bacterium]|nr:family 43 glycosylhydrolase [Clostridia bacterium]
MAVFFKPSDAVCADFIPYYENGTYYLFYLKDYRDWANHGEGTPWFLVTTKDFVHFEEHGEVLPRGTQAEQDLYVFTGSVFKAEGVYHIFYTGHNPHLRKKGLPEQAVMHAVSRDLFTWEKKPEDTFFAPAEGYEPHDWRDPFVYWDEDAGEYRMLLAARSREGAPRRRGMTALCGSKDLKSWRVLEPFWAPARFFTHECPDLFKMGDWYYLIYSEFSEEKLTRYRMSRSLQGPWLQPKDDRLDGIAYYAAKSAAGEEDRYLFGWIPSREGESDTGAWQWGGCLCVHRLCQREDGTLYSCLPDSVWQAAAAKRIAQGEKTMQAQSGVAAAELGELPQTGALECRCTLEGSAAEILLHMDEALDEGFMVRLDQEKQMLAMDRWPRDGHLAWEPGLMRPMADRQEHVLRILMDGSALCVYLDGEIALCSRAYDRKGRKLGFAVKEGRASIEWTIYKA